MPIIPNINNQSIAILSDIEDWKKDIAAAINTKGGDSTGDEAFQQLADDIKNLNDSFITYGVTTDGNKIDWVNYICQTAILVRDGIIKIEKDDIEIISSSYVFYNCINLLSVAMQSLTTISGANAFQNCRSLQEVNLPKLTTISGASAFQNCSSLQEVNLPKLTTISGAYAFQDCSSLQEVNLPKLTTISGAYAFLGNQTLKIVKLQNLVTLSGNYTFQGSNMLQDVTFGILRTCVEPFANVKDYIRNITIGEGTDINLPFSNWRANNVINEGQSGIDELNSNLYNNLLTKLYDHSNDGETRTLRLGWLDYVTLENIAYATAKGWTLTN